MLQAETKAGKLITLASMTTSEIARIRKDETFFCPECKEKVIVRAGPRTIPHFAHQKHSTCPNNDGGESSYHLRGKFQLYQWLKKQHLQTKMEVYFPAIQQRADIFLQLQQKKVALEYQCSRISLLNIQTRNHGYEQENITPIWIVSKKFFNQISSHKLKVDNFLLQFVHQFTDEYPGYLYFYCPKEMRLTIVQDVILINKRTAIASIRSIPLISSTFFTLFSSQRLNERVIYSKWKKAKESFRLSRYFIRGEELAWRNWLYEKGYFVESLPSVVYLPSRYQHLFTVSLWNWQSRFIIDFFHPLPKYARFTIQEVQQFLEPFFISTHSFYQDFVPLKQRAINEYLDKLKQAALLLKVKEGLFQKMSEITMYRHIEEAFRGDAELLHRFMYNQKKE